MAARAPTRHNSPVLSGATKFTSLLHTRGRSVIGWWGIAAASLATLMFAVASSAPLDPDVWWHLANGRFMLTEGGLPAPDRFSFTAYGRDLVLHEWLSDAVIYWLYQAFGLTGPMVVYALVAALTILITVDTLRRVGVSLITAVAVTLILMAALVPSLGIRPQIAGLALLAAELWLLERWAAHRGRIIWFLPLLIGVWANLHGSFVLGLLLPLILAAGEGIGHGLSWNGGARLDRRALKILLLVTGIAIAAAVVNPDGAAALAYGPAKVHDPLAKQYIIEWQSTDIGTPTFWPFTLLAGSWIAAAVVRRPGLLVSDLVLAAFAVGIGLTAQKYTAFAAVILTILTGRALSAAALCQIRTPHHARLLSRWWTSLARRYAAPTIATQGLALILPVIVVVSIAGRETHYDPASDPRPRPMPVAAVDALGAEGLQEPIFNHYDWGGYLIWRLWPQTRVFIDGRADMYLQGGEFRDYVRIASFDAEMEQLLNAYGIRTVLYPKDSVLTRALQATGQWHVLYDDGRVVALRRAGN